MSIATIAAYREKLNNVYHARNYSGATRARKIQDALIMPHLPVATQLSSYLETVPTQTINGFTAD